jgi:transposase
MGREPECVGVVLARLVSQLAFDEGRPLRVIGLEVHRDFSEVAISDGGRARSAGRIDTSPQALELFASSLAPTDRVVLETTGNARAIARILEPHVAEVVLANPMQVRAICHAKVKNDRFDARTLAELLAVDLIPRVWITDERTRVSRRLTSRRAQLVRQRTRVKNEVSAVLVRNLKGRPPPATCSASAGAGGWPSSSCPPTSATPWRRAGARSTSSTARSPALAATSPPMRWPALRCGG